MGLDAKGARKRFEKSPVGSWFTYLGGGQDMLIGMSLTFLPDGSGTMEEHGFDQQYDPTYVSEPAFRWRSIGSRCIEIRRRGESRSVVYDFRDTKNEYGLPELRMFEPARTPDEFGEIGFWISPFSFVYREQPFGTAAIHKIREICARFCARINSRNGRSEIPAELGASNGPNGHGSSEALVKR